MTFTPAQLAKEAKVGRGKIMHWITTGQLAAFNVGEGESVRYRISQDAWRDFQERRTVKPAKKKPPNRRITKRSKKEWF